MILKPPKFSLPIKGHWATRNLAACWLMNDDGGGTITDISGNFNQGSLEGDTSWAGGKFRSCLSFDGSGNDYVEVQDSPSLNLTQNLTLSMWFKIPNYPSEYGYLIAKGETDDFQFALYVSTNDLLFKYDSSTVAMYNQIPDNEWHLVTITISGTPGAQVLKWYFDGKYIETDSIGNGLTYKAENLFIGRSGDSPVAGAAFSGLIDDVRIYNRVWSANEISQYYYAPFCGFQRELIELWVGANNISVEGAVQQRLPTGDTAVQWTRSAGASNYLLVDDTIGAKDDDTTYNHCVNNDGFRDLFSFSAFTVPTGATINHVKVIGYFKRAELGGAHSLALMLKVNGSEYTSSTKYLGGTVYTELNNTWLKNPDTDIAWTVSDVNTLLTDFGYKYITAYGTQDTRCTQVYIEVDYNKDATETPGVLALGLTLNAPDMTISSSVSPELLSLALTLNAPTIINDTTILPDALALGLTLNAPTILIDSTVLPDVLTLGLTLNAPTITYDYVVLPDTLALGLTLNAPTIITGIIVTPDTLALGLTLNAPVITYDYVMLPDALAMGLTLNAPTILTGMVVTPDVLTLGVILNAPSVFIVYDEIPPAMLEMLIKPYSGGACVWLCEVIVPGYDTIRLARNTANINYSGYDYRKHNIEIGKQIFSGDGSIPQFTIRVAQDKERTLETIIDETQGVTNGHIKLIRVHENFLDMVIAPLEATFDILVSEADDDWVTFALGIPNPLLSRIPLRIYSSKICPYSIPGLFKGPECQYAGVDTSCTGTIEDCRDKGNEVHWGSEIGLDPSTLKV